jgi:hypothetical protein
MARIRERADEVNKGLADWARTLPGLVAFVDTAALVPFPYGAPLESDALSAGLWSFDGLHMSKLGYEMLGCKLAPLVSSFLGLPVLPPTSSSTDRK